MFLGMGMLPEGSIVLVHRIILDGDLLSSGGGGGVQPASRAAIAALKEVKAEEKFLGDCAICLEAVEAGKELLCGHKFHGDCVEKWLAVHGSCPMCRFEIPRVEELGESAAGKPSW